MPRGLIPVPPETLPRRSAAPSAAVRLRVREVACFLLLAAAALPGCSFNAMFAGGQSLGSPMDDPRSKSEAVARVNANALAIQSWRSNDVKIGARGMPVELSAQVAVERDRNFRMRARSTLGGDEADLGSNDERFWFWMRRSDVPHVVTVRHDELHLVQPRVQIPFQPDWLMEVLGVVPIDETQVTMQAGGRPGEVLFHSETLTPAGLPVRRVIRIDARHGIVLGHSLFDEMNRLIAKATLSHHQRDRATQVILPHRIDLEWPQADMSLTMKFRSIEINGGPLPPQTWQMPHMRDYPPLDLGRQMPRPTRDQETVGRAAVGGLAERQAREEPQWHRPILHVKPDGASGAAPQPDPREAEEDVPPWTGSQADWQSPRWRPVEEPPWTE